MKNVQSDLSRMFRLFLEGYGIGEIASELENREILTPGGGSKWEHTTVKSMLKNEKFMGDLLLQKSFIEDFLTKKLVKNEGQFPQYYVENAHPPIVPKEVFMRVQGELMRQEQDKTAVRSRKENALFGLIVCGSCGERYRRYKEKNRNKTLTTVKWRCGKRVSERNGCDGRAVLESEIFEAVVKAFRVLPDRRDEIIRMQERIIWGPLEQTNRELDAIDKRKCELENVISDYAATGHIDRRTLFLYSEDDEEIDEETAVERISDELEMLEEKRDELLIRKGDLGIQEANLHTILKLVDRMMMREERELLMTGTDGEGEEMEELSRSKNLTAMQTKGVKGGRTSLPWAFSESGIYMLMTVLKGDLATQQSKALIRTFRAMKDYIIENQGMVGHREYLQLSLQVTDSVRETMKMRGELNELGDHMKDVLDKLSNVVMKSEIAPILLELGRPEEKREYLLLNGQPAKADETYIDIYSRAKHTVYLVDNYINIKTLRLLQDVKPGVAVTVFSDNHYNKLHASDYADFQKEFPGIPVNFQTTAGIMHDRFIVLDYGTADEQMYHCGASSKDAGVDRTTAIAEFTSDAMKKSMHSLIDQLKTNPPLILK